MRTLIILAMLISLLLTSAAVYAEDTNLSANDTESSMITEETDTVAHTAEEGANVTAEEAEPASEITLAKSFGSIQGKLLLATEEAYSYLAMNDEKDKQAFLDEIFALKKDFTAYEEVAKSNETQMAVLKPGFEKMQNGTASMLAAAEKMFASFEKNEKPVAEDVRAFKEEVEVVFNSTSDAWSAYREMIESAPTTAIAYQGYLYNTLNAAIQETYAYPVTGDKVEKEDALANLANFDELVAQGEEKIPDFSFEDMKTAKAGLMGAAEAMFSSYDTNGSVKMNEVLALEKVVEDLNASYFKFIGEDSKTEVAEEVVAEGNVTPEESNTTVKT